MRSSIKIKMILYTTMIIFISLLLSGAFSYKYFSGILKDQAVKDQKAKLSQTIVQMEFILEDTSTFSLNILSDEDIQTRLKNIKKMPVIDKVFENSYITNRVRGYIRSRNYIQSIAFVFKDGTTFWSNDADTFNDFFTKALQEDWYQSYEKTKDKFTKVHPLPDINGRQGEEVISYITPISDINSLNNNLGELIVNINFSVLKNMLNEGIKDYSDFIWTNQSHDLIFQKETTGGTQTWDMLQNFLQDAVPIKSGPSLVKEDNRYILLSQSMSNGLVMNAFISKKELFHRLDFIYRFFLLLLVITLAIAIILNVFVTIGITKSLTKLIRMMRQVSRGNLDVSLTIKSGDEIEEIANVFNRMITDLKDYIKKLLEEEQTKKNMEFNLLLLQINPHFIYNTLSTVIYLARGQKNQEIVIMMEAFIKILQDSIKLGDSALTNTVKEEKEIIDHYMLIQQFRYKDKFKLEWQIAPEVMDLMIPKTILQPLIENALFHGISPRESTGRITVTLFKDNQNLRIVVEDDGVGMNEAVVAELLTKKSFEQLSASMHHIGIANIDARIKYFYGEEHGLSIKSIIDKGTRITIKLPLYTEM